MDFRVKRGSEYTEIDFAEILRTIKVIQSLISTNLQLFFEKFLIQLKIVLRSDEVYIKLTDQINVPQFNFPVQYSELLDRCLSLGQPLFLNDLDSFESTEFNPNSILLFFPIVLNDHRNVGSIVIINPKSIQESTTHLSNPYYNALIDIMEIACMSISKCLELKQISLELQEKSNLENRTAVLLQLVRTRSSSLPLNELLSTVTAAVDRLLGPEKVSIYFCDHIRREVFICQSKGASLLAGLTFPFDYGVAGKVASTGQPMRIANAYTEPEFYSAVDEFTGNHTQSILCVPVAGFEKGQPLALLQALNKAGGFSAEDQATLTMISEEFSIGLKVKAGEILKVKSRETYCLEMSLLEEYGSQLSRYTFQSLSSEDSASSSGSKVTILPIVPPSPPSSDPSLPSVDFTEATRKVKDFHTDPFLLSEGELLDLAVHMFRLLDLLTPFSISPEALRLFLAGVQGRYRPQNPYHNFFHAWSVMHLCFNIVQSGPSFCLQRLDLLALLLAALCHDIDHTGVNNAFEVASRSELALTYCDDVVLERHHASTTVRLLESPEGLSLLQGLSPSERTQLRQLVVSCIMATDMGKHFEAVEKVAVIAEAHSQRPSQPGVSSYPFNAEDLNSRKTLLQLLLHSADIGSSTQALPLALKWVDRVLSEFKQQAEEETRLCLPPTPFMHGLDTELKVMHFELGFIANIVVPLWSGLTSCFPELSPCMDRLGQLKEHFSSRIATISSVP